MTYEGLRLKVNKYLRKIPANTRKKKLKYDDFTIISNNCWGGMIYESYNLPKESPTVGLFFMASDYIKFLSDIHGYLEQNLSFIDPNESKYKDFLETDPRFGSYPIGKLKDIEIMFLHYHSEEEAKEKWERRCKRVNWNRLLVKFNDQNGCTERDVKDFLKLPYKNKLFFTCHEWPEIQRGGYTLIRQPKPHDCIRASYEPFGKNRYFDLTEIINNL